MAPSAAGETVLMVKGLTEAFSVAVELTLRPLDNSHCLRIWRAEQRMGRVAGNPCTCHWKWDEVPSPYQLW